MTMPMMRMAMIAVMTMIMFMMLTMMMIVVVSMTIVITMVRMITMMMLMATLMIVVIQLAVRPDCQEQAVLTAAASQPRPESVRVHQRWMPVM